MAKSILNRCIRFLVASSLISSPLAYAKGPQPEPRGQTSGFAWGRGELPSIPNNPQKGQTFQGFTPDRAQVWFTGDVGANGLPEVERFNASRGHYERGPLQPDGTVGWTLQQTAKAVPASPAAPTGDRLAPLPPDRSLVPYADGPKHWERMAEWNAKSEEKLHRAVTEFAKNPSKAMVPSDGIKLDWKTVPGSGVLGDGTPMDYNRIVGHFTTQAIAWGLAMGFLALVKISTDYSNNPTVIQDYFDSLKGPVGWLGFIGFSIGYGLVYAKMVSDAPYGGMMKRLPGFMAALLAGTAVQFGVTALANDPMFKECAGFAEYERTGKFRWNLDACQAHYESGHAKDMIKKTMKDFVPALLASTIAGISYFALYPTAAKFFMDSKLGGVIVDAGSKAGVSGGLLRLGLPVGIAVALIWATQSQQKAIADSLSEWWKTTGRWQSGPYAETLSRAEEDLFTTWEGMKKAGFANPAPVAQAKRVCYDPARRGGPQYDCAKPALDFEGVLEAYGQQQSGWRAGMLEPTYASMGKWYQKTMAYKSNLNAAHSYYKVAIEKIMFTRLHPEAPASDERVFNSANMRKAGGGVWATRAAVDGTWRNLNTDEWSTFFMASLACGPETEGSSERGFFGKVSNFVAKHVTGYASPDSVIEDARGWKTKFHPPRITDALMDSHETVCDNRSYAFGSDKFWKWMPTNGWTPADLVVDTAIKAPVDQFLVRSQGVNYAGLPEYILANVRPSVISPDARENYFERWWGQTVGTQDVKFDAEIDRQYQKMLFKTYLPILSSADYYWCESNPKTRGTGVERYLNDLASPNGQACGATRTHRLARGVTNGLIDEARLYVAMAMDLFATSGEAFRPEGVIKDMRLTEDTRRIQFENIIRVPSLELVGAMEKYAEAGRRFASPKEVEQLQGALENALNKFSDVVLPAKETLGEPKTDRIKRQREVMATLALGVFRVAESLATYVKIGTNGRVTAAPVWKETK